VIYDPEAALGAGKKHEALPVNAPRADCKPLPRGFLKAACTCIEDMNDYGIELQAPDVCCVADGGDLAEHLAEQRTEAELEGDDDDDPQSFHAVRDLNVQFRFRLYAHGIKEMGLLGRGRVPLPLCYMSAVREIWPSKSGEYKGFVFKG
jgi:hypothetical protein